MSVSIQILETTKEAKSMILISAPIVDNPFAGLTVAGGIGTVHRNTQALRSVSPANQKLKRANSTVVHTANDALASALGCKTFA